MKSWTFERKDAWLLIFFLGSCIESLDTTSIDYENKLVVEGFLSSDLKQHRVKLSHTSRIDEKQFIAESGARVVIEDQNGKQFLLNERMPGIYLTEKVSGVTGNTYVLNITTSNGKQYRSSGVQLKNTPPIKNIYAKYSSEPITGDDKGSISIFLDAEDPTNQCRYYRWDYTETYEIKTPFPASFIWLGGNKVVFRDVPVDRCWGYDSSRNSIVHSTEGQSESKVTAKLIKLIPGSSPNMRIIYSILIRQTSVSKEGYKYWKTMRDLNETQGSLYDYQPGTLRGNITSVTDDEMVLGYFDAGVVHEKRVFYRPDDFLDSGYRRPKFLSSCENLDPIDIAAEEIGDYYAHHSEDMIISEASSGILHLRPKRCCDCTDLGTNIKPSFWP